MSKYKKVYEEIKYKIDTGILKANQELPTENDLMAEFGFSKDTIRRALSRLELDGYIQKTQGKNSIVLEHSRKKNNFLTEIRTSSELNKNSNHKITTHLTTFHIVQGEPELMDIFKVDDSVDFYKIARSRAFDGDRSEYDISYFDRRIVPYLNKDIVEESIYKYLENELKLNITHSRREITFRYANKEEKKNMDLGKYDMVVVVTSMVYLSNGQLFQYETISYRPDEFVFVTMAKR